VYRGGGEGGVVGYSHGKGIKSPLANDVLLAVTLLIVSDSLKCNTSEGLSKM
jgi:hypothetical protein